MNNADFTFDWELLADLFELPFHRFESGSFTVNDRNIGTIGEECFGTDATQSAAYVELPKYI